MTGPSVEDLAAHLHVTKGKEQEVGSSINGERTLQRVVAKLWENDMIRPVVPPAPYLS